MNFWDNPNPGYPSVALPYVLWKNKLTEKIIMLPRHYKTNIMSFKNHI